MITTSIVAITCGAAAALAAASVGVAAGAKHAFGSNDTQRTQVSRHVERIVVQGKVGTVELSAGGGASHVEVTRTTSWLFSKPRVRQYVLGGVLHLESACHGVLCETDFTVRLPAGLAVDVREQAGDVEVTGSPGDVSVQTDAGDVHIDLAGAPRRIEARTVAGDVSVEVPSGAYAVTTQTGTGEERIAKIIRWDLAARSISVSTGAGDATVEGR